MAIYRMYTVGENGRLVDAAIIHAENDEEALAVARGSLGDRDLDVWTGTRRVALLSATPESH